MLVLLFARIDMFLSLFAVASQGECEKMRDESFFFGLPTWYKYLKVEYVDTGAGGICKVVVSEMVTVNGKTQEQLDPLKLGLIGLSIVDSLLRIAGMVAVAFVIWGGIKYITSQGEPENTKEAMSTIINACIGLAIAMIAAAVVAFIGKRLG